MSSFGIFGPLPPPRHGVSAVNEAMAKAAAEHGLCVSIFNTAPRSLLRIASVKFVRFFRVIGAILRCWCFVMTRRNSALYISMSGSWGLLYEGVCVLGARCMGAKLLLHHHSFRYLDAGFIPMSWVVFAAGPKAVHVVLGRAMGDQLRSRYPRITQVKVLSNAFIESLAAEKVPAPSGLTTVGYLANLSKEKGLDEVLATARLAAEHDLNIQFIVAGPFEDISLKAVFETYIYSCPNVRYVGPVYGADKESFFRNIDLLVFPTKYRHEAEPLVILEAMSRSRPVIAYARGCISDMIGDQGGYAVDLAESFPSVAVNLIHKWQCEDVGYVHRARKARKQYLDLVLENGKALSELLS